MADKNRFQSGFQTVRRGRGLSTVELLVSMGVLALLVGVSVAVLGGARRGRSQAMCAANLHAIGLAFSYYTQSNQDTYPAPTPDAQWEDMLRDYVPRSIFRCPGDNELFESLGSSYDWRDTSNSNTTLAGRPVAQVARNNVSLSYDALPGWHAPGKVQVLQAGGTIELMGQADFFRELQLSPNKP